MNWVTLETIAEINPRKPADLDASQLCTFVPMESVDDWSARIVSPTERQVKEVERGYTYFADGDVLFAKITPCMENGKCALAYGLRNNTGFGSTEFHVIRAGSTVSPEWIYYFIRQETVRQEAKRHMTGSAGQQRVPASFVAQIKVPLPPLPEQQRIAGILSRADRLRRLRRYALEMSESYLQSVFIEMFGDPATNPKGWEEDQVGAVIAKSQYGTSERSNSEKRGYPVLGMGNITYSGEIDLSNISWVDLSAREFAELRLEPGDVVFNRTNSTELVGKTAHWSYSIDAVLASYLVKLRLVEWVLPSYFTALLNTGYYKHLFQTRCLKAVGQSNISPTLLKEFPMMIPSVSVQQKYGKMVDKHDRLRKQQRESLRQAEHLFQTLLRGAFRGEV